MEIKKLSYSIIFSIILITSSLNGVSADDPEFLIERHFGVQGNANGEFTTLIDLVYVEGKYYIADYVNDRVQVYDSEFNFVETFGGTGAGLGQLDGPYRINYNGSHIYVNEVTNDRISIFTLEGNFVDTFGTSGSANGQLDAPSGIAFDDDLIYISDFGNQRISVFNHSDLSFHKTIDHADIVQPYGIVVENDIIYLLDNIEDEILMFNKLTNAKIGTLGTPVEEAGHIKNGFEIQIVNEHIVVTDSVFGAINIYDFSGQYIKTVTGGLDGAYGFAILENQVVIAEGPNERASIFRLTANPSNVVARAGHYGISLTWDVNEAEGITNPTYYNIYRDNGISLVKIAETQTKSYTDVAVLSNESYTYYVESNSIIGVGDQVASNTVSLVTIENPVNTISDDEDEGFFSQLPINILPFVFVLMMIPILRRNNNS